jgi:hypothetical protein
MSLFPLNTAPNIFSVANLDNLLEAYNRIKRYNDYNTPDLNSVLFEDLDLNLFRETKMSLMAGKYKFQSSSALSLSNKQKYLGIFVDKIVLVAILIQIEKFLSPLTLYPSFVS